VAHLLGYARVSTALQDEALQLDALKAAGCARIYTDHVSTRLERRPQLDRVLERADAGDTIVVWRLDRLGRSLKELIGIVTALGERGVQLRSLTEALDTATPGGRLLFHIMGSIAEFERDLIRERTMAGLAAARARGRKGGRPSSMTPHKVAVARQMYDAKDDQGRTRHTVAEIAAVIGTSRSTIYKHLGD
jgi:DNA invertase Pin-like site-specific DNA recombinase